MSERAPAKVNLALHVGPRRGDGLHFLCSLFASVELHDEVALEPADADEVVCDGVPGENLAQQALAAFRAAAPDAGLPPMRRRCCGPRTPWPALHSTTMGCERPPSRLVVTCRAR